MTSPTLPPEAEALVQEARVKLQHRGKCDVSEPHNDCATGVLRDLARRLLEPGEKELEALRDTSDKQAVAWKERAEAAERSLSSLRADGWLEKAAEEIGSEMTLDADYFLAILKRHRDGA